MMAAKPLLRVKRFNIFWESLTIKSDNHYLEHQLEDIQKYGVSIDRDLIQKLLTEISHHLKK